jgi:hypothetical protein
MTKIQDIANAPKILQRQAEHALTAAYASSARLTKIREALGVTGKTYLGEVVTLDGSALDDDDPESYRAGVYAVETHGSGFGTAWTTLVRGHTDHMHFTGQAARWSAILHAIALVHGDGDSHATGAFYAGRVLGLPQDQP